MTKFIKWGSTILFILMIGVNFLANSLPIGGHTTGQVSADYPNLFTPSPFTFSIWAVIYFFMLIYIITQHRSSYHGHAKATVSSFVGPWFMVSCFLNILWILCWHTGKIGFALIVIIGLLVCLLIINFRALLLKWPSLSERASITGFQIYLGWISAASLANLCVFLTKKNLLGFGVWDFSRADFVSVTEQSWTIVVIVIGTAIGFAYSLCWKMIYATYAVVWAYFGILIKHVWASGYGFTYPQIVVTLIIAIGILLFAAFYSLSRSYQQIDGL